jgi:hypothetical protein
MSNLMPLDAWLASREVLDLPAMPVATQLSRHDAVGTGLGFVFVLVSEESESERGVVEKNFALTTIPVLKVRGEWLTVADENLADIFAGFIRMVAPEITKDVGTASA